MVSSSYTTALDFLNIGTPDAAPSHSKNLRGYVTKHWGPIDGRPLKDVTHKQHTLFLLLKLGLTGFTAASEVISEGN